jgi:glutathione S-transferase
MSRLVLHSYTISPYAAKVRAVLSWKGLAFDEIQVHPLRRGELRRKSGQVLVPILEDGSRVIVDSTRIVAYLDEQYPEKPVLPADPLDRARTRLYEEWADEGLPHAIQPVRWLIPHNWNRVAATFRSAYPAGRADDVAFEGVARVVRLRMARRYGPLLGFGSPARHLNRLCEALDLVEGAIGPSGWLVGAEPSVADFAVAGWISLLRGLDGWESVKMRRKLVKLTKALIPERDERTAEETARPAKDAEAYDAQDQALIEASRLRRASKGQV